MATGRRIVSAHVGGSDTGADAITISETHASADTYDAHDIDPDLASYDVGNDPETACRTQGSPDSPDRLYNTNGEDHDQAQDGHADQNGEHRETGELPRMWGDDLDAIDAYDADPPETRRRR
jgi:hypothetical protein